MIRSLGLIGLLLTGAAPDGGELVAIQAGTIHVVEGGQVIEGGGTIVLRDGKVVAVGKDVAIPAGARVVDYGADAVIAPGFVAANSSYGAAQAAERTASPTLLAVDNFDPYTNLWAALRDGITSVYLAPARGRLIAGQGAVVKTHGDATSGRVISGGVDIHGSISAEARRTPGYWQPPVPATVDVGLGVEQPQLPRTTMGAIVALQELVALQGGDTSLAAEYGADTGRSLAALVEAGRPWRIGADSAEEVGALIEFFQGAQLPLVIEAGPGAGAHAKALAEAGIAVITGPANRGTSNFGKGPDAAWPTHDTAAKLAAAGVKIAIAARSSSDLRFTAALAMRGGLGAADALHAITLAPAQMLGIADRVGSLTPGKDGDLVVLNGPPLAPSSGVIATWVSGEIAWKAKKSATTTVLEVEELHVGDGTVLRPGQILMEGGRILDVGTEVSHPAGAVVVRGAAAMPGMIDALGQLGLEGSNKSISSRFDLRRIVEPGDYTDRRVAQAGVTTVNLSSARASGNTPTMAYKPAGTDVDRMVIAAPASLRMSWTQSIRASSGESVRSTLEKAAEYKQKWEEYEAEIAKWTPPVETAEGEEGDEEAEEKDDESDEEAEEKDDEKKKKKKKGEKEPARPVTGEWNGTAKHDGEAEAEFTARLRLLETHLALEGTLRVAGHDELILLTGRRAEYEVTLSGSTSTGGVEITLELDGTKLSGKGTLTNGVSTEAELAFEQTSDEYPMARRPERRKVQPEKEPKGKPRSPGINPELEPLRQAMMGKGSIIVSVSRADDILACVDAFEAHGIRPVLWGARGIEEVVGKVRGRIAGVLSSSAYGVLARNGIPVAFNSMSEEGAAGLPTAAAYATSRGLGSEAALRALTSDAASLLGIGDRVGRLKAGLDADVLLLDGSPLSVSSSILRVWVNGEEVR